MHITGLTEIYLVLPPCPPSCALRCALSCPPSRASSLALLRTFGSAWRSTCQTRPTRARTRRPCRWGLSCQQSSTSPSRKATTTSSRKCPSPVRAAVAETPAAAFRTLADGLGRRVHRSQTCACSAPATAFPSGRPTRPCTSSSTTSATAGTSARPCSSWPPLMSPSPRSSRHPKVPFHPSPATSPFAHALTHPASSLSLPSSQTPSRLSKDTRPLPAGEAGGAGPGQRHLSFLCARGGHPRAEHVRRGTEPAQRAARVRTCRD